jgi:uroporphyrinogen-III synthase
VSRALECRVAVLRVGRGGEGLCRSLLERGADATTITVGSIVDRHDGELRTAVGEVGRFAWAAVTSANAARRLELWAGAWPPSVRIAVVGASTAAVVEGLGLSVDAVSREGTARSLAGAIDAGPVLFLAASSARADLVAELGARAIEVTTVIAYDVVPRALDAVDVRSLTTCDVLLALSPTAVDALCGLDDGARATVSATPLVAIGPTTAAHAATCGWPVAVVARASDGAGVVAAVESVLAAR